MQIAWHESLKFGQLTLGKIIKSHIMMGFDCYLMNLDGAVHPRCLYITIFPRLMLLFVN